jgi:hypothetical protein
MSTAWPKRDVWNEVKRGWSYALDGDPLVTGSNLVLRRKTLGLIHRGVDFARGGMEGVQLEYFLQDRPDEVTLIPEAAWADWDHRGRLLIATREGTLEVRECHGTRMDRIWSEDLSAMAPDPTHAPAWAGRW